ncbi:FAD-binding oxidoreductase [Cryobacterium tagatosivorans]|uniref:FAD-binding oxidoreductase n=1 Tax=Cryobacterium tagatosivorans TaxID=1259199 RepID=A0A4R8UIF9_9MICO|nr:FAD-binding oxidoreductase [Cryobacterium tagatosivorans]TFB55980.1 FAD-binding oxidoreductase [Cryobacterium tagatosivorans]
MEKSVGKEASDGVSGSSYLHGQIERELTGVLGREFVSRDPADLQAKAADWSWVSKYLQYKGLDVPAADFVVRPGSTADVERIVEIASDYKIPVIPRGGGSGTQGGTFAPYGGIAVDLTRLNKIIEIDEESLVVTAEAGLEGPLLEEKLNEKGLTLAHYPGSYHLGATLGGYVAARGSGVVSTKYGKAEDQVLQVEAVVPPGKTIQTLRVPSHAAGPDLLQTLVGSEGTLGIITKLSFRLDPLPEVRDFLSFSFPDIFAGIEAARLIMTRRLRPAVIRLYDEADSRKLQEWVGTPFTGTLMVIMCDGDRSLVDYEMRAITEQAERAGGHSLGPEVGAIWWEGKYEPYAKGKLPAPPLMYGTFDTVARFADLPKIYRAKKEAIESKFGSRGARYTAHFSHWFPWGGMVYDRFYVDNPPEDPAEAMALHDELWDAGVNASLANGGTINEHHGVGLKLGRFMRPQYGTGFDLMRGIKDAWDPDGIMNPGKLGFGPPRNRS